MEIWVFFPDLPLVISATIRKAEFQTGFQSPCISRIILILEHHSDVFIYTYYLANVIIFNKQYFQIKITNNLQCVV